MPYIADIVNVLIFSFLGIILMIVGNMIIDQFIPGDFPTEIKKGNSAVAWVCAGSFIGMGEIVRTAIQSPTAAEVEEFLLHGIMLVSDLISVNIFAVIYMTGLSVLR